MGEKSLEQDSNQESLVMSYIKMACSKNVQNAQNENVYNFTMC